MAPPAWRSRCQRCRLGWLLAVCTGWVTAKEQLQQLVAHLGEEQASRALGLLEPLRAELPEHKEALIYLHGGDQRQRAIADAVSDMVQTALGSEPHQVDGSS
jgi:hypothetical protein